MCGNKRLFPFPCIACQINFSPFDDLSHAYRNPTTTLKDHQQFMLDGKAWQRGGAQPTDRAAGPCTQPHFNPTTYCPKNKHHEQSRTIQAEFKAVKMGLCSFPVLATSSPNADLGDLYIAQYEVALTEPLHEFEGHIVVEVRENTRGSHMRRQWRYTRLFKEWTIQQSCS